MTTHLSEPQLDERRAELERQLKTLQRSMRTTTRAMKPVAARGAEPAGALES